VTRIDFYRYAPDKLRFACRLAAIAWEREKRVVVYAPDAALRIEFDRLLWTFQSTKFVPHCVAGSDVEADTPVVIAGDDYEPPHHEVLLNLGADKPPWFASFDRLLEVVGADDADKALARDRYSFYKKRGYEIQVNDISES
jgi:DNA polymerase III subunit chi